MIQVDTAGVLNEIVDFDFIEDPVTLNQPCEWEFGKTGHLRQSSNAGFSSSTQIVFGCHAIVRNVTMTDFIMQTDIYNDDDDAVGFDFGAFVAFFLFL